MLRFVCLLGWPRRRRPKTVSAGIGEFFFRADRVRVDPGDTVTWTNRGEVLHNVTSRRGAPERFRSGDLDSGQTYSRAFARAGTYDYLCAIHPTRWAARCRWGRTASSRWSPAVGQARTGGPRGVRLSERASVKVTVTRRGKTVRTLRSAQVSPRARGSSRARSCRRGRYRVVVTATDLEGNRARSCARTLTVSLISPTWPMLAASSGSALGSPANQASRISSSSASLVVRSDSASTLASFHLRAPAAVSASAHSAARTPSTLFAAIDAPVPGPAAHDALVGAALGHVARRGLAGPGPVVALAVGQRAVQQRLVAERAQALDNGVGHARALVG